MNTDPWLDFLNSVGATFWRGFPYDILFLAVLIWGCRLLPELKYAVYFMAAMICINLAVGTVPAWFEGRTY